MGSFDLSSFLVCKGTSHSSWVNDLEKPAFKAFNLGAAHSSAAQDWNLGLLVNISAETSPSVSNDPHAGAESISDLLRSNR